MGKWIFIWTATQTCRADLSVDNVNFRAIVVVDAGKLQPNVASSDDCQLLGQAGQVQDVVRDDGVLCTFNWQLDCSASCGYEDHLGLRSQIQVRSWPEMMACSAPSLAAWLLYCWGL